MPADFPQIDWNQDLVEQSRRLIAWARQEDLPDGHDWTSEFSVPAGSRARVAVVSRGPSVVCGLPLIELIRDEFEVEAEIERLAQDGDPMSPGGIAARLVGPTRGLLMIERTLLNFIGSLSGIATLTAEYCRRVAGTPAQIYDTRKTLPGWRGLQKYAVRQGGGRNHRMSLSSAILIKDNHVAANRDLRSSGVPTASQPTDAAAALDLVRTLASQTPQAPSGMVTEIEVDTWEQFASVISAGPDIILLDNMTPQTMRKAVQFRDEKAPDVVLEASGGVHLESVAEIAASGIDRISVGALTHSAPVADFALDWEQDDSL